MNHIIKEIDYCADHAQYSPLKIYAGDIGVYSLNCDLCLNEVSKEKTLRRPKKVVKPLNKMFEDEQAPLSLLK